MGVIKNLNDSRSIRKKKFDDMKKKTKFAGHVYILGCGNMGTIMAYTIDLILDMPLTNITIFDKEDYRYKIMPLIRRGVTYKKVEIKAHNYKDVLGKLTLGDILVDCTYCIATIDLLKYCQERGAGYINSSIEDWDDDSAEDCVEFTMKRRVEELDKMNAEFKKKGLNYNAIISMGCNPGNVSIWTKKGLEEIYKFYNKNFEYKTFADLAQKLKVNTIHIAEKDTQKTVDPRKEDEYCNTWSSHGESWFSEASAPVEISWGTHEKVIPEEMKPAIDPYKNDNYMVFNKRCFSSYAQSYTPISKNYVGMLVAHEENFTIARELTVYDKDKIVYKPSVYYVYHPCDSTMNATYEVKEKNNKWHDKVRLLTDDIERGRDELGMCFFLENGNIFWIGSILDINEARDLFDNKINEYLNATNVQVVGGYFSGFMYLVELANNKMFRGLMCPDELPHEKIWEISSPFLGPFIFMQVEDWVPHSYKDEYLQETKRDKNWQFYNFLVKM